MALILEMYGGVPLKCCSQRIFQNETPTFVFRSVLMVFSGAKKIHETKLFLPVNHEMRGFTLGVFLSPLGYFFEILPGFLVFFPWLGRQGEEPWLGVPI